MCSNNSFGTDLIQFLQKTGRSDFFVLTVGTFQNFIQDYKYAFLGLNRIHRSKRLKQLLN